MDISERLEALRANLAAHNTAAGTMSPFEVSELLDDLDTRWREAWKHLPRDMGFDKIYALRSGQSDVIPRPFLFRHLDSVDNHAVIEWTEDHKWSPVIGAIRIVEWLVENPPWPDMQPIADLFEHADSMARVASPWVLLMTMIGKRAILVDPTGTSPGSYIQDIGGPIPFSTLIPIGEEDANLIGRSLKIWGNNQINDIAREYIYLLDGYSSHR